MIQYFYKNQTTGCSNFGQFSLTVVDNPALAIYGYQPNVCYGQFIQLINNRFSGNYTGQGIQDVNAGCTDFNSTLSGLGTH